MPVLFHCLSRCQSNNGYLECPHHCLSTRIISNTPFSLIYYVRIITAYLDVTFIPTVTFKPHIRFPNPPMWRNSFLGSWGVICTRVLTAKRVTSNAFQKSYLPINSISVFLELSKVSISHDFGASDKKSSL